MIGWYIENVGDCFNDRFFHIIYNSRKLVDFGRGLIYNDDSSFLTPVLAISLDVPLMVYIYIYLNLFALPEHLRMLLTLIIVTNF